MEENFEDICCTNTAYAALSRLFFVRICEDSGSTTHKISNSGIAVWRNFVQNIKGNYQDLLDVAFKDVAHVYSSLFEAFVFDWFGKGSGLLKIFWREPFSLEMSRESNGGNFREPDSCFPGDAARAGDWRRPQRQPKTGPTMMVRK